MQPWNSFPANYYPGLAEKCSIFIAEPRDDRTRLEELSNSLHKRYKARMASGEFVTSFEVPLCLLQVSASLSPVN